MNIGVVGGYTYPVNVALAERDLRVLGAYRETLGTVVVIVQSPDGVRDVWEDDGVIVCYTPPRHWGGLRHELALPNLMDAVNVLDPAAAKITGCR